MLQECTETRRKVQTNSLPLFNQNLPTNRNRGLLKDVQGLEFAAIKFQDVPGPGGSQACIIDTARTACTAEQGL